MTGGGGMRKLRDGTGYRRLGVQIATVIFCGVMASGAVPAWGQAPATTMVVGPMGINRTECISVAQNTAAALGGSQQGGDATYRAWVRGNFSTSIICNIPGYAVMVVAGPNGSVPSTELNAVRSYFVSRANPSRAPAAGAAPAAAPSQMPPLPRTVEEALSMSRPADPALLMGRWTDDGLCRTTITFNQDGTFQHSQGTGRWSLAGETLTFTGSVTRSMRARAVGQNRIFLIHPNGTIGQSIRC